MRPWIFVIKAMKTRKSVGRINGRLVAVMMLFAGTEQSKAVRSEEYGQMSTFEFNKMLLEVKFTEYLIFMHEMTQKPLANDKGFYVG